MTGGMIAVYASSLLVIGASPLHGFAHGRVLALGAALAVVAVLMLVTRPPEPGTITTHAMLATTYLASAISVACFSPHGSATVISGLFTGPLLAVWLSSRRAIAAHLLLATATLLAAALLPDQEPGTLFAAVCLLIATWVLALCCTLVLEAFEAQSCEYDRLALRDALTGVGNARAFDDALTTEVTRHLSASDPLAVIELQLSDIAELNALVGRAAGDGVLATVAHLLADLAPPNATIARIAGDRFAVVLPSTDAAGAAAYVELVRTRLRFVDTGDVPMAARAGIATLPVDATRPRSLREIANDRATRDVAPRRAPAPAAQAHRGLSIQEGELPPVPHVAPAGTPSPEARADTWAKTRVDREAFARDRMIWRLTGAGFLVYAAVGIAAQSIDPAMASLATHAATALGVLFGLVIFVARAPAVGTWQNHAVVAGAWGVPIAAMAACAPHASWAVGTASFGGALIATRLTSRLHILAHLLASSGVLWALILSGQIDRPSILAILSLLLSSWVLVGCYVSVYEPAEAQGREMAELVVRDPLTGAGNQRLLRERLADELPRHDGMQMPLVLLDIELDGVEGVRDRDGRGAATDVLRDAAVLLSSAAGEDATVARIGGDHFRVIVPLTASEDLEGMLRDLRRAIAGTSRHGRPILPRIGAATFPDDGLTEAALVEAASSRMREDDARAHDLTTAPDPLDEPFPATPRPREFAERRRSVG